MENFEILNILMKIIPECGESCRSHLKYYKYFQKRVDVLQSFQRKGLGYCKFFQKWAGILTTSIKKGENAPKMQKYV